MDIVVVDGIWYMPHHWLIRWRGLDQGVHCLTLIDDAGKGLSPEFTGIKARHIDHYKGRRITIHRLRQDADLGKLLDACIMFAFRSRGYDFRQWVLGFVLGLTCRSWVDQSDHWTCAELPYWAFQSSGASVTPREEVLPMPRMFRYNPAFETIFEGVW